MNDKQAEALQYHKAVDLVTREGGLTAPDLSTYTGEWENTNAHSQGLASATLTGRDGTLYLSLTGVGADGPIDWGEAPVEVFSSAPDAAVASGFMTSYTFPEMDIRICSLIKLEVMVLQIYTTFTDGSPRQNYFTREFYVKKAPRS